MASSLPDTGTRSRSNSGEDSGLSEHERKRPRLSEGISDDKHRSEMSHIHQDASEPSILGEAFKDDVSPALPPRPSGVKMTSPLPTSEVTINTRPLSQQSVVSSHFPTIDGNLDDPTFDSANVSRTVTPPPGLTKIPTDQPETISISSSPGGSPVIEIAEPIAYDQDTSTVNWTHRVGGSNGTSVTLLPPKSTVDTFPFADSSYKDDLIKAIENIAVYLSEDYEEMQRVFREWKGWLVQVADTHLVVEEVFFAQNENFWIRLPDTVTALLGRKYSFAAEIPAQDLVDLFVAVAKITSLLVQYDNLQMRRLIDEDGAKKPKSCLSPNFLLVCIHALNADCILYRKSSKEHGQDSMDIIEPYASQMLGSTHVDLLNHLSSLVSTLGEALAKQPKVFKDFVSVLDALEPVIKLFPMTDVIEPRESPPIYFDKLKTDMELLLNSFDTILKEATKKQLAWLTPNTAAPIMNKLGPLMQHLGVRIPRLGQAIILSSNVSLQEVDFSELHSIMTEAWRFKCLYQCMKVGRMPLRVWGAETMSQRLVAVYSDRIQDRRGGQDHTLVRYLVRFLRDNDIVSYLVSADSHPQIIHRSANLVGFLMVSGTYEDSDTDTIWRAVLDATESRIVAEVLPLLQGCFMTFHLAQFYHLCRKLLDLPAEKLEDHFLRFAFTVLSQIHDKIHPYPYYDDGPPDPVVRHLCIRLMRLYNTPAKCITDEAKVIRTDVLHQLASFSQSNNSTGRHLSLGREEISNLLEEIRFDLESQSETTSGSVLVVEQMLSLAAFSSEAVHDILIKSGLPDLLVNETKSLSLRIAHSSDVPHQVILMQFKSRIDCLITVLRLAPETLNFDLFDVVWQTLLVATDIESEVREYTWKCLTRIMKEAERPNTAVDFILGEFWQRLRPIDLTPAVLEFAQQSIAYESGFSIDHGGSEEEIATIPGLERVWNIMLDSSPNTVEMQATDFVIAQYLQNPLIKKQSRKCVNATHLHLIDRCVNIVLGAAARLRSFTEGGIQSNGDDGMVIIASEDEIRAEERRFDRALLFLRRFIEAIKSNPGCSPITSHHFDPLPEFESVQGDRVQLVFQVFDSRNQSQTPRRMFVGTENTGAELWAYCAKISGMSNVDIIHGGKRHKIQHQVSTLSDLNIMSGTVLVKKAAETDEKSMERDLRVSSPVDEKIMLHFDDLYALLESDNRLAKEVFDFLSVSTVREKISEGMKNLDTAYSELLPSDHPYKLLFCTQALRSCVEVESFSSTPDTEFLLYAVKATTAALGRLSDLGLDEPLRLGLALQLTEVLRLAFRAKVPEEVSSNYLLDPKEVVAQLSRLLELTQSNTDLAAMPSDVAVKLIFEVLTEMSLHDQRALDSLASQQGLDHMLQRLLLDDTGEKVRRSTLGVLSTLTGSNTTKSQAKNADIRAPRSRHSSLRIDNIMKQIWTSLANLMFHAMEQRFMCHEYFDAILGVFRKVGTTLDTSTLEALYAHWTDALSHHEHCQVVGQALQDHFLAGIAKIVIECARLLRVKAALPTQSRLIQLVMDHFMFPALSNADATINTQFKQPVLDVGVREVLYDLLLMLSQTPDDFSVLVSTLSNDLIPRDFFESALSHERQCLKTDVGYAGLKNLSNTCYLNSLFTQLFMNVQFRDLFFKANADPVGQRLISELGKVFAYMQNSDEKSVDPTGAVESITTYEGEQIDVTVQMDVDEFFNLLFDRLESQLMDPEIRASFKSMYGGETIQQIKSRECEHVSERPEGFAVLPVEIKNKSRLEDSLASYVEGEVLQGDNKYSCTACGRHVDAVKRSCLKEVPDNLIFNLKRFDYDILTGTRTKLNDQFQFPMILDMAPYTLAQVTNPEEVAQPDVFELTGVIVHSGTAETGHYYSYIRQRPSARDSGYSWVQFNDQDVTSFDPNTIYDTCFGGFDSTWTTLPKFYNAYMLFYQRKSNIQQMEQHFEHRDPFNPLRLQIPGALDRHILKHNELYLRTFCAQDFTHARLVRQVLERVFDSDRCSENHDLEAQTLQMSLQYVNQISSRCKERYELEPMTKSIQAICLRCPTCSMLTLEWFTKEKVLPTAFLRSPYQATRKAFGSILITLLQSLHKAQEEHSPDAVETGYLSSLKVGMDTLWKSADFISRTNRIWTEVFGVFGNIAQIGPYELQVVLDAGFLELCTDLVNIHFWERRYCPLETSLRSQYPGYLNARERNRTFNHSILIECFAVLLLQADLHLLPDADGDRILNDKGKVGLSLVERQMLGFHKRNRAFEWLGRIIAGHHNLVAIDALVSRLASNRMYAEGVMQCIIEGLSWRQLGLAANFTEATLSFCQNCYSEEHCIEIVDELVKQITMIDLEYGHEFLLLVKNLLAAKNDIAGSKESFLMMPLVTRICTWAPVFLVSTNETHHNVRQDAVVLIRRILFDPMIRAREDEDSETYQQYRVLVQKLATGAVQFAGARVRRDEITLIQGLFEELTQIVDQCCNMIETDGLTHELDIELIQRRTDALRIRAEQTVEVISPEWQESSDLDALSEADYAT